MASCSLPTTSMFAFLLILAMRFSIGFCQVSFNQNYYITWGNDHVLYSELEGDLQLSLDQFSGAGFESNQSYGSGFFHMRMKLPDKNPAGVVTTFYFTSHTSNHDEVDFEFLGNDGTNNRLQTNVFVNGIGAREQRINLWFDPSQQFHSYRLLWNQYQLVFYVDDTPIRVFKNLSTIGVPYPSQPMQIEGSLWDGESWASKGKKIDWNQGPFKAHYQGFDVDGCYSSNNIISDECHSSNLWWNNADEYSKLNSIEEEIYKSVTKKYMYYDYCSDPLRRPTNPAECQSA